MQFRSTRRGAAVGAALLLLSACERQEAPASNTFYERAISPMLVQSCAQGPAKSGCHTRADDRGNALGNLNVDSYESLSRRRDLLLDYGPYGMQGLLLKVVPRFKLALTSWKSSEPLVIDTNIAHVGGSLFDITSPSFARLQTWMNDGAVENNTRQPDREYPQGECATAIGSDADFDPSEDPAAPDFATFRERVNGVLGERCAASNCHGSPANSLHLTCGENDEQRRWNYFAVSDYVSSEPSASEILQRTLSPSAGGTFHEGGTVFSSTDDAQYRALLDWATEKGGPSTVPTDPGFEFFTDRVQPMLVRRGCMMLGCHSAAMFHDYRLRGGSGGHFGLPATRKNYELTLEQLALESPNPEASRLIRKNLLPAPAGGGILHRGGALLADHPETCDFEAAETGPLDEQSEYCVIAAWIRKEREARLAEQAALSRILFVRRAPAALPDTPQDYATFSGGAELFAVDASLDDGGALTLGAEHNLSTLCGLGPDSEARRAAVSWDGRRIAFSARRSATERFVIYVIEGDDCAEEPDIARPPVDDSGNELPDNGELVHDFDPAFAPDGRLVFASTRGNVTNTSVFTYSGPQRTPADPSKTNANLYVLENGKVRQLTFLLNQELSPSFMRDGRVILITEKRQPGFYQLAGRRINLDGGDYHPLFGQRQTIGYDQFTDVVELADKNFAAILSERGAAHGAGALVLVNRSLGVDQRSPDPSDYTQDPDAIDWPNPVFFQRSMRLLDPDATGRLDGTVGAYRNPSPLPDGRLLVSYAANVVSLADFSGNFDVAVVDPITGARSALFGGDQDELWPVAVYGRPSLGVFRSRLDEANGATQVATDSGSRSTAQVTILDADLLASLLFQNTRTPRHLSGANAPIRGFWESLPPPPGVTSFGDAPSEFVAEDDYGQVYVRRRPLGAPQIYSDNSASVRLPGGVPVSLEVTTQLADEDEPQPHFQREEMQFYPGENARQAFPRNQFDHLCGGCHGSVSGYEDHVAANPDILTQASSVIARSKSPTDLTQPAGDEVGP